MRAMLILILYFSMLTNCFSMDNVFYVLHDQQKQALQALSTYKNIVNTIIFQAYVIDSKGNVSGDADKAVIEFGKSNHIRLMPMVTNSKFDAKLTHQFLSNPDAKKLALNTLLAACKKNRFYGIQFDFEMIPLTDKKLLTDFY